MIKWKKMKLVNLSMLSIVAYYELCDEFLTSDIVFR